MSTVCGQLDRIFRSKDALLALHHSAWRDVGVCVCPCPQAVSATALKSLGGNSGNASKLLQALQRLEREKALHRTFSSEGRAGAGDPGAGGAVLARQAGRLSGKKRFQGGGQERWQSQQGA